MRKETQFFPDLKDGVSLRGVMKTNFKFKTHDKVYCPSLDTKVYSLCSTKNPKHPLQIKNVESLDQNNFLTIEGKYRPSNKFPFVFPATNEWKEKLEALYGEKK